MDETLDGTCPGHVRDIKILAGHVPCTTLHLDMGASFVIEYPANSFNIGSFANINFWPFSTRAEIAAIFIALLTAPSNSDIEILTDSQCVIFAVEVLKDKSQCKWLLTQWLKRGR